MLGFLIAIAAGAVTPMLEGPVGRPIAQAMADSIPLEDGELRVLTFVVTLMIAALLCTLLSTGSALGLAVGGGLGYFGMRILRWLQRMIEGRKS